jgi:hypothetical protein
MLFNKINQRLSLFGVDIECLYSSLKRTPRFVKTALEYKRRQGESFPLNLRYCLPYVNDYAVQAGVASGHYFWQDHWVAKRIYERKPKKHIDVGSRIDGFISSLLVFMPVTVIDVRPMSSSIEGLSFIQDDATELGNIKSGSVESISALHSIEHFGLGRYGDPVDPEACFRAMRSLARVLRKGGRLYLSVPIGVERLYFNAHRVFSPHTVLEQFGDLKLVSFSAVDDAGNFKKDAVVDDYTRQQFACGIFEFTRT